MLFIRYKKRACRDGKPFCNCMHYVDGCILEYDESDDAANQHHQDWVGLLELGEIECESKQGYADTK